MLRLRLGSSQDVYTESKLHSLDFSATGELYPCFRHTHTDAYIKHPVFAEVKGPNGEPISLFVPLGGRWHTALNRAPDSRQKMGGFSVVIQCPQKA